MTLNEDHEIVISIADEQSLLAVDQDRIRLAVERVLQEASIDRAEVSVALVDDPAIHELNRTYLEHDYPTDVLSFVLEHSPEFLEGQIIVSTATAQRESSRYGWLPEDELLLYVIHGALHLVGYDDLEPAPRAQMRRKEKKILGRFGLESHWSTSPVSPSERREE